MTQRRTQAQSRIAFSVSSLKLDPFARAIVRQSFAQLLLRFDMSRRTSVIVVVVVSSAPLFALVLDRQDLA